MTCTTFRAGDSQTGGEVTVEDVLGRARSGRARLDGNVADCFRKRIDHETFVARNAAIWREIGADGHGPVVEALLRGDAADAGVCAQRLVDGVVAGARPCSPAPIPAKRDAPQREVRMPYKDA